MPFEDWIQTEKADQSFKYDSLGAMTSDLVIYIGPSGMDAAAELGMAYAKGKLILGLWSKGESFGLMRKMITVWFDNYKELLRTVAFHAHHEWPENFEPVYEEEEPSVQRQIDPASRAKMPEPKPAPVYKEAEEDIFYENNRLREDVARLNNEIYNQAISNKLNSVRLPLDPVVRKVLERELYILKLVHSHDVRNQNWEATSENRKRIAAIEAFLKDKI